MEISGRRHFFRLLARDALVAKEEAQGVRHIRLDRFTEVPDSKVGQLVPMIQPGLRVSKEGDDVVAILPEGERVRLFHSDDPRASIFGSFNGQNTIGMISSEMSRMFGWTPEDSMSAVRALFLRLANLRIVGTCNCWQD
jgi:hypothetical protein